jgi:hypothetical protein
MKEVNLVEGLTVLPVKGLSGVVRSVDGRDARRRLRSF